MDINDISDRVLTIRQEIRELQDKNDRYWGDTAHSLSDKSEFQNREIRLSQIKQELSDMRKSVV
jgi:hypothetical protein